MSTILREFIKFSKKLKSAHMLNLLIYKETTDKLNIFLRTYQNYELTTSNNREPDLKTLCKISKILSVSIDSLLGIEKY